MSCAFSHGKRYLFEACLYAEAVNSASESSNCSREFDVSSFFENKFASVYACLDGQVVYFYMSTVSVICIFLLRFLLNTLLLLLFTICDHGTNSISKSTRTIWFTQIHFSAAVEAILSKVFA